MQPAEIKEVLNRHHVQLSKKLGQNFLICDDVVQKVIAATNLTANSTVLEVGAGLGVLTKPLSEKAHHLIAVEKDRQFIPVLEESFGNAKNVEIVHDDILTFLKEGKAPQEPYTVCGNIPYYLTSHLLKTLHELKNPPERIVLVIQKEVAERITATPPRTNILAVSVQFFATPAVVSTAPRVCFWPQPRVDSAILALTPHTESTGVDPARFFKLVRAGFAQPRKKLLNNLAGALGIDKGTIIAQLQTNNIDLACRAENLALHQWHTLFEAFFASHKRK